MNNCITKSRLRLVKKLGLAFALAATCGITASAPVSKVPYEELRLFSDIFASIKQNYVDEVEDSKLMEGAVHGMLKQLDPYSVYLTKREYNELKIGTTGKFGGLGIEVGMDGDYIRVNAPIENTPAMRAGLQPGDLIVQIGNKQVKGMTLSEGVDLMRGEVGTKVTLMIVRDGGKPFPVELKRAVIKRQSVKGFTLDDGIAYVRISNFQVKTGQEVHRLLDKMQRNRHNNPFNGILLDIRSNPGGILNEAVDVADVFLDAQKLVVYTQGRRPDSKIEYRTRRRTKYKGIPVVILIDQRSASASEIVTGALKDHRRAVVMGWKSFGKASVQTVHPIDKMRALKLTTARYYTPSGNLIHDSGIMPDIDLTGVTKEAQAAQAAQTTTATAAQKAPEKPKWMSLKERVQQDVYVQRAVEELKTMSKKAEANKNIPTEDQP